jgi:hypothetical protein
MLFPRESSAAPALAPFKTFIAAQCRQLEARIQHDQQVTRRRG